MNGTIKLPRPVPLELKCSGVKVKSRQTHLGRGALTTTTTQPAGQLASQTSRFIWEPVPSHSIAFHFPNSLLETFLDLCASFLGASHQCYR
jgi:hypothetical protein